MYLKLLDFADFCLLKEKKRYILSVQQQILSLFLEPYFDDARMGDFSLI